MLLTDAFLNESNLSTIRRNTFLIEIPQTKFGSTWTNLSSLGDRNNLVDDESLSSIFQRAVVLQRAGDHISALREYQTFIKAAESCEVSTELYAEVHVNMGAIYIKSENNLKAKESFNTALKYREIGSAYVNLALLTLSEGRRSQNPIDGIKALREADIFCQRALDLKEDPRTSETATMLSRNIQQMLEKAKGG